MKFNFMNDILKLNKGANRNLDFYQNLILLIKYTNLLKHDINNRDISNFGRCKSVLLWNSWVYTIFIRMLARILIRYNPIYYKMSHDKNFRLTNNLKRVMFLIFLGESY